MCPLVQHSQSEWVRVSEESVKNGLICRFEVSSEEGEDREEIEGLAG